jgi:transmembrane protein EpsG
MILAYLMALILVVPVLIFHELMSKNNKAKIKRYTIVAGYVLLVFVIIVGLRDTASISIEYMRQSDEFRYRKAFDLLVGTPFSFSNVTSFEWGRYILDWTLANIFKDSQIWVFTYALITNYLYIKAIKKYVKPFWLGVFLYITVGLLTFQMNGTASVLASAILLTGINYITGRNFWKFLFVVFIAGGIHFSAWIMLPLYFVLTKKIFTKATPLWIAISVLFMFWFNSLANLILPKTPYAYYLHQINSEAAYGVNIFRILIFLAIYIFILLFIKKIKDYSVVDRYFTNVVVVLLSINIVSSIYVYIYRFNEIFIFALIYMLPRVINSFNRSLRYPILVLVIIAFFIFGIQQNWNVLYENILFQ